MGWGTEFRRDIYLNKKVFHSMYALDCEISELQQSINEYKTKIQMYIVASPNNVDKEEFDDIVNKLYYSSNELFELYEEDIILLDKLIMYKEELENGHVKFPD